MPYHGRLYISDTNACFYSSVLLKETKVSSSSPWIQEKKNPIHWNTPVLWWIRIQWTRGALFLTSSVLTQVIIPVSSIHIVKKQNTALLVPNALSIRTTEGDKVRFRFTKPFFFFFIAPDQSLSWGLLAWLTEMSPNFPVPVCVAAEQRILFSTAVFTLSTSRGEFWHSKCSVVFILIGLHREKEQEKSMRLCFWCFPDGFKLNGYWNDPVCFAFSKLSYSWVQSTISESELISYIYKNAIINANRMHFFSPQDGSTNSSPVFSSAENSFDKSKLVVRDLLSRLLHNMPFIISVGIYCWKMPMQWYSFLSSFDRTRASPVWMTALTSSMSPSPSLCRNSLCTNHTKVRCWRHQQKTLHNLWI